MNKLVIFLSISILCTPTVAWWCFGHMAVAEIARKTLESEGHTEINTKIEEILKSVNYKDIFPDYLNSACWPDTVFYNDGIPVSLLLHVIQLPYNPDNLKIKVKEVLNITWALDIFKGNLLFKGVSPLINGNLGKSIALRFLIHLVGDIHCPVHAATRYTPDMPDGDANAGYFHVKSDVPNISSLHSLWDLWMGYSSQTLPPISDSDKKDVSSISDKLMSTYPISKFREELKIEDFMLWAEESYKVAVDYVYVGIKEGDEPSEEYKTRGLEQCYLRIVLAGYRLAKLLTNILHL